jgi:hypothetical protein
MMGELIARLEKATGPDRRLDVEIHCLIIGRSIDTVDLDGIGRPGSGWTPSAEWPPYTASIDAALTLVPRGHKWSIACGRFVQYVARVTPVEGNGYFDGECDSTPAIALCIAALRARTAKDD